MDRDAQTLLTMLSEEISGISQEQHRLARRRRILEQAATRLRTGKSASVVEAELEAELPQHTNLMLVKGGR